MSEKIITGAVTKEYEEGWERIFGQREKEKARYQREVIDKDAEEIRKIRGEERMMRKNAMQRIRA
jgi:hypothetical protein